MQRKQTLKSFLVLLQFVLYFLGISVAAGGGNYPGLAAGTIIFIKLFCLCAPIIGGVLHIVFNRRKALSDFGFILRRNAPLFLYMLFGAIALPLAVDPGYSLQRLLYMIGATFGIFALIMQYMGLSVRVLAYDILIRHITILTFVTLIFPFYVLAQYGVHNLIPGYRLALQGYLFIHPNLLASFYAHLAAFHLGVILYATRKKLYLQKICLAALMLIIVLLFSRAVFVSCAVSLMAACCFLYRALGRKVYMVIPMVLGLGAVTVMLLVACGVLDLNALLGAFTRGEDVGSLATLTNRTKLWHILLDELNWKTVLVGNGYSVMTDTFGVDFGTGILYGAHNAYLSILLGTGVFSLLCVVWYWLPALLTLLRTSKTTPVFASFAAICSLTLFAVNCLTAEEMGVSVTVTFAYLVFLINMLVYAPNKAV